MLRQHNSFANWSIPGQVDKKFLKITPSYFQQKMEGEGRGREGERERERGREGERERERERGREGEREREKTAVGAKQTGN